MPAFHQYYRPILSHIYHSKDRPKQKIGLVVGMLPWKNELNSWIIEDYFVQIQRHFDRIYFNFFLKPFIKLYNPTIYIWGYKAPRFFIDYIREHDFDVFFLEDGFIRSAPDDDKTAPPLSIVMDSQAPYFDTTRPNDLTDLLENFDCQQNSFDKQLAQEMLDYYVSQRVSKYNHQEYVDVRPIYGIKEKYRILVLGQVARDDSLKYGSGEGITLIDLTQQAIDDYPDAQIIVKPHPMSLNDRDIMQQLEKLNCSVIDTPLHLVDALETVDNVYTITSLGGFEAFLRGKEVTVLGKPFYKKFLNKASVPQIWICIYLYHQTNFT